MKIFLKIVIHSYWLIVPPNKRRKCIFKESCSTYVYNTTQKYGFIAGLKALNKRFKQCRPNYEIILLEPENLIIAKLSDGTLIQEEKISLRIINSYKFSKTDYL